MSKSQFIRKNSSSGNMDKQGANILIQTIYKDRKVMGKNKDMDIREADINELADILEIEIDRELSDIEKKREFIRQIRNPYLYRQGEYVVKISFADTDATLTDRLKEYIEHVAAAGL